jgi:hypothetical protein
MAKKAAMAKKAVTAQVKAVADSFSMGSASGAKRQRAAVDKKANAADKKANAAAKKGGGRCSRAAET